MCTRLRKSVNPPIALYRMNRSHVLGHLKLLLFFKTWWKYPVVESKMERGKMKSPEILKSRKMLRFLNGGVKKPVVWISGLKGWETIDIPGNRIWWDLNTHDWSVNHRGFPIQSPRKMWDRRVSEVSANLKTRHWAQIHSRNNYDTRLEPFGFRCLGFSEHPFKMS